MSASTSTSTISVVPQVRGSGTAACRAGAAEMTVARSKLIVGMEKSMSVETG
mgnify:CR=1 FL=1